MARGATKNYSMPKTPDSGQSESWNFLVKQEELLTSAGKKTGLFAVIREDNNEFLGKYSGEKAVQYPDLVNDFEQSLSEAGIAVTNRNLFTTRGGARLFGRYEIGQSAASGDPMKWLLELTSSHDGSLTIARSLNARRLVCLNGMIGWTQAAAMSKRHQAGFDTQFLAHETIELVQSGQVLIAQAVEKMGNIQITDRQERNILSNIVNCGEKTAGVSPKIGYLIHHNWQNPSADEKPLGNTLYRLYNATTRLCRDIETVGRFEHSRRANLYVTGAFDLALRQEQTMRDLFSDPKESLDFDGVTVDIS